MNAHKIIDNIKELLAAGVFETEHDVIGALSFIEALEQCVHIDLGDQSRDIFNNTKNVYIQHLPFERMYVEFTIEGGLSNMGCIVWEDYENQCVRGFPTQNHEVLPINWKVNGNNGSVEMEGCKTDEQKTGVEWLIYLIFYNLRIINCSNVELIDNKPSKLKQRRIKKNKTKMFDYKTVHIKPTRCLNMNPAHGGKHESQRLHVRRGHIRNYKNGKSIWIDSYMAGTASKGIIKHDYKLDHS